MCYRSPHSESLLLTINSFCICIQLSDDDYFKLYRVVFIVCICITRCCWCQLMQCSVVPWCTKSVRHAEGLLLKVLLLQYSTTSWTSASSIFDPTLTCPPLSSPWHVSSRGASPLGPHCWSWRRQPTASIWGFND